MKSILYILNLLGSLITFEYVLPHVRMFNTWCIPALEAMILLTFIGISLRLVEFAIDKCCK